jgi:predicted peptidase
MLFIFSGAMVSLLAQPALFQKMTYKTANNFVLPYRFLSPVSAPAAGDSSKTYPLVIFLHGAGERGIDNEAQLINGIAFLADSINRANHPAFIIAPQCPEGLRWVEVDWSIEKHSMPDTPSVPMKALIGLIDEVITKYPIDVNRVYITGLSMGGFGTWDLVSRFPGKFAAAIPVCGGADVAQAPKLVSLPIHVFHGAKDPVVKVIRSRTMVDALQKAGGKPLYTEYPDGEHNIWNTVYADRQVIDWLFAQERPH